MKKLAYLVCAAVLFQMVCVAPAALAEEQTGPYVKMEVVNDENTLRDTAQVKISVAGMAEDRALSVAQIFIQFPDSVEYASIQYNKALEATQVNLLNTLSILAPANQETGVNRFLQIAFTVYAITGEEALPEQYKALTQNGECEIATVTFKKGKDAQDAFDLIALEETIGQRNAHILYYPTNTDSNPFNIPINGQGSTELQNIPFSTNPPKTITPTVTLDYSGTDSSFVIQPPSGQTMFSMDIKLTKDGQAYTYPIGIYGGYDSSNPKVYPVPLDGLLPGTYEVEISADGYKTYKTTFAFTDNNSNLKITDKEFHPGATNESTLSPLNSLDFARVVMGTRHPQKDKVSRKLLLRFIDYNRDGAVTQQDLDIFRLYW